MARLREEERKTLGQTITMMYGHISVVKREDKLRRILVVAHAYGVQIARQYNESFTNQQGSTGESHELWHIENFDNAAKAYQQLGVMLLDSPGIDLVIDNALANHTTNNPPAWDSRGRLDASDIVKAGWAERAEEVQFAEHMFPFN